MRPVIRRRRRRRSYYIAVFPAHQRYPWTPRTNPNVTGVELLKLPLSIHKSCSSGHGTDAVDRPSSTAAGDADPPAVDQTYNAFTWRPGTSAVAALLPI